VNGSGEMTVTRTVGTSHSATTTTTTYDGAGHILRTVVDPANGGLKLQTDYAYDSAGRPIADKTPSPDGSGEVVRVTLYDSVTGRIAKSIENCVDTTPAAVWSACTGTAGTDGTRNVSKSNMYDTAGNITRQLSPTGAETTFTYDAASRVTSSTTNNATTAYYYDPAGRKSAVAAPNEAGSYTVTRYGYDAAGHIVAQISNCTVSGTGAPTGDAAIASCSGTGIQDGSTNIYTSYKYDGSGNLVSRSSPSPSGTGLKTTQYAYDADGRVCRILENTASGLDLALITNPCTASVTSTTTTNLSTAYTYDAAGNLTSATQAADPASGSTSATTSYIYDGAGHLISQTDADGRTTSWSYDALGHKATQTDPDTSGGATVAWLYDAAGRMCRRVAAATNGHLPDLSGLTAPCTDMIDAAIDTRYGYDSAGNAKSATDAKTGQAVSATYDSVRRPTGVTNTGGAVGTSDPGTTFTYASLTDVTRTDPSGSYTFTLDAYGRQKTMSNSLVSGGAAYTWTYGPTGALTNQTEPLGTAGITTLVTDNTYDALGRLATRATKTQTGGVSGPAIDTQTYAYNAAGAEVSATDTIAGNPMSANGTSTYTYDPLGRLASATTPNQPVSAYGWNASPDRATTKSGSDPTITSYFSAASHPISDTSGASYSSDQEGRLTAQPGQRLKWDNLGRLVEVDRTSDNSVIETYSYDPIDRLVSVLNSGVTTTYLYAGLSNTIAKTIVTAGSSTIATTHLTDLGGAELAEFIDTTTGGGTTRSGLVYLGRNGHTDVTFGVDASGVVVSAAVYDPFGRTVGHTGTPPAAGWQGSLYDGSVGLYYVVARWYSPTLGRFLSVDPVAGSPDNPQSLNRYAYVSGNPIGGIDPDGRLGKCLYGREDCAELARIASVSTVKTMPTGTKLVGQQPVSVPPKPCVAAGPKPDGSAGTCSNGSSGGLTYTVGVSVPANGDVVFFSAGQWGPMGQAAQNEYASRFGEAAWMELEAHKKESTTYLNHGVFEMADRWYFLNHGTHLSKSTYIDGEWASFTPSFYKFEMPNKAEIDAAHKALDQATAKLEDDAAHNLGGGIALAYGAVTFWCGVKAAAAWLMEEEAGFATCFIAYAIKGLAVPILLTSVTVAQKDMYFSDVSAIQAAQNAYDKAWEYGTEHGRNVLVKCTASAIKIGCYNPDQDVSGKRWETEWNQVAGG